MATVSLRPIDQSKTYTLKKAASVGRAIDLKTAVEICIGDGDYITNVVIQEGLFSYKVTGDVYTQQK